jgi:hypothetical protein
VKVLAVLKKAIMPALCNWEVTSETPGQIVPKPESMPAVYFNEAFTAFARFDSDPNGSAVQLRCLNSKSGQPVEFVIPIAAQQTQATGKIIEKLWAKGCVDDLETQLKNGKDVKE